MNRDSTLLYTPPSRCHPSPACLSSIQCRARRRAKSTGTAPRSSERAPTGAAPPSATAARCAGARVGRWQWSKPGCEERVGERRWSEGSPPWEWQAGSGLLEAVEERGAAASLPAGGRQACGGGMPADATHPYHYPPFPYPFPYPTLPRPCHYHYPYHFPFPLPPPPPLPLPCVCACRCRWAAATTSRRPGWAEGAAGWLG